MGLCPFVIVFNILFQIFCDVLKGGSVVDTGSAGCVMMRDGAGCLLCVPRVLCGMREASPFPLGGNLGTRCLCRLMGYVYLIFHEVFYVFYVAGSAGVR